MTDHIGVIVKTQREMYAGVQFLLSLVSRSVAHEPESSPFQIILPSSVKCFWKQLSRNKEGLWPS